MNRSVPLALLSVLLLVGAIADPIIIGVVSTTSDFPVQYDPNTYSYIKDSYPHFVESAGATPIFIPYDLSDEELYPLLDQVHGVLFTGGGGTYWVEDANGARDLSPLVYGMQRIVNYVKDKQNAGEYLPLFGICQGYEVILMALTSNPYLLETDFNDFFTHVPIYVTKAGYESRVYANNDPAVLTGLAHDGTLFFNHHFGYNQSTLDAYPDLKEDLEITALGYDQDNREYVASYTSKTTPTYLSLYHPERVLYESEDGLYDHSQDSVDFVKNLAAFYVSEAAKSPRVIPADGVWNRYDFRNYATFAVQMGTEETDIANIYLAEGTALQGSLIPGL